MDPLHPPSPDRGGEGSGGMSTNNHGGPTSRFAEEAWRENYPACPCCGASEREACTTPRLRKRKPHVERQWAIEAGSQAKESGG